MKEVDYSATIYLKFSRYVRKGQDSVKVEDLDIDDDRNYVTSVVLVSLF